MLKRSTTTTTTKRTNNSHEFRQTLVVPLLLHFAKCKDAVESCVCVRGCGGGVKLIKNQKNQIII